MKIKNTVRWGDGSHDSKRTCDECGLDNCPMPVHNDFYEEKVIAKSYTKWQEGN